MPLVYDLRCESEIDPLCVPVDAPRFSWKLRADGVGVVQTGYRLQVASDAVFNKIVWDSGETAGERSRFVESGARLSSNTRYYCRGKVRCNTGEESPWSEASWFETAREGWGVPFIRAPEAIDPAATSRPVVFRREFDLPAVPETARAYATALGVYELRLNGALVGDAVLTPGWTAYGKRVAYQTYDTTALLRRGRNVVTAVLAPGWYAGELTWLKTRNLYGSRCALSVELTFRTADGAESVLRSDRTWKCGHGPYRSAELYHGETYDARDELTGADAAGYDDSAWFPAEESDAAPTVVPQDGPAVRRQEELPARALVTTPKGERLLDFGQVLTGWVSFTVRGRRGDRVVLRHAEILDASGNFYDENMRNARNRIEYVLKGEGVEAFAPRFSFQGFRYVLVEEYPGTVDLDAFRAVVVHSDMPETLRFECSNPMLEKLHRNIAWGWRGNSVDIPTDCPQRDERLGWTGDAQVFIGTAAYLRDVGAFFRKWLRDLRADQLADGGVPFVVPDVLSPLIGKEPMMKSASSSTGWGDAAVVCPWTLYERYGDARLLEEQYPSMRAWIEYIRARAENGVLWNTGFHFGDWVALDAKEGSFFGATPNDLTATAYYAYSTGLVAQAAAALGKTEDAERYRTLRAEIVEAFRAEFLTPAGRLAARTQTAHVLALVFGLVPENVRRRTAADLARLIRENGGHLTTGFLGTPLICRALAENGMADEAYALLLKDDYPSWLYPITKGATTIWEHWDGLKPDGTMWSAKMNSFNHYAYGAVGQWMYETMAGLSPDRSGAPGTEGFKRFIAAPRPGGGIDRCSLEYDGPYGPIRCAWRIVGRAVSLELEVPPNSSARVFLEGKRAADVADSSGHGRAAVFTDLPDGASCVVGSGMWRFAYPR